MRDRCLTVSPPCASPSTPYPARNWMLSWFGLISVCVALRLTAVTTPAICVLVPAPDPLRLREGWCPESDLNRRPTAYEAVALPLSYRRSRRRPAPFTYRIVTAAPTPGWPALRAARRPCGNRQR